MYGPEPKPKSIPLNDWFGNPNKPILPKDINESLEGPVYGPQTKPKSNP